MNYRETPRTALILTGNIAAIFDFQKEVLKFLTQNKNNKNALLLFVHSSGGITEHIFGICALLRRVQREGHPVYVHVLGQLAHFTYMIGAVADWFIMEPNASLIFAKPLFKAKGNPTQIQNEFERATAEYNSLIGSVMQRANKKGVLSEETVRGWRAKHLTAQEAFDLGLCDEVLDFPTENQRSDRAELEIQLLGSFTTDINIFDTLVTMNKWLENKDNYGANIHVTVTSQGGGVTNALAIYGMLLEAQRRGHHVTIHVNGEAYSCALWFMTAALESGSVELDPLTRFMYHQPWTENLEGSLDEAQDLLGVEMGQSAQTSALLKRASGVTDKLLTEWQALGHDHYFDAQTAEKLGFGKIV
jgi:ATP-dependent protease ClpP protease subunit